MHFPPVTHPLRQTFPPPPPLPPSSQVCSTQCTLTWWLPLHWVSLPSGGEHWLRDTCGACLCSCLSCLSVREKGGKSRTLSLSQSLSWIFIVNCCSYPIIAVVLPSLLAVEENVEGWAKEFCTAHHSSQGGGRKEAGMQAGSTAGRCSRLLGVELGKPSRQEHLPQRKCWGEMNLCFPYCFLSHQ